MNATQQSATQPPSERPAPVVYAVEQWGSHPDDGNDDCWTGEEFSNLEAARAYFDGPFSDRDTRFIALVRLEGDEDVRTAEHLAVRKNPNGRKRKRRDDSDVEWRREMAMEAGMLHGVEAYNDVLEGSL